METIAHATQPTAPVQRPSPPSRGLAWSVIVLAGVWAALAVVRGVAATVGGEAVRSWWGSSTPDVPTAVLVIDHLGVVIDLLYPLAITLVSIWLLQLRHIGEQASRHHVHRRSSPWVLFAWIVPVVNLWYPLQVVSDIGRQLGARVRSYGVWWGVWLVVCVPLSFMESWSLDRAVDTGDLGPWLAAVQVMALVVPVAGVLWIGIVRAMTAAAVAATEPGPSETAA